MTLFLVTVAAAFAGDVFGTVEAESSYGMAGTWARFYAVNDGYWFFQVAGGDGWVEDVDDSLGGYNDRDRLQLTEHGRLQDAQMERCPDGGWLLLGSYTSTDFDDSAQAWRYEADFTLRWTVVVVENDNSQAHNDMVPVCGTETEGAIFGPAHGSRESTAVLVDLEGGAVNGQIPLDGLDSEGSSWAELADGTHVAIDTGGPGHDAVRVHRFNADWSPISTEEVPLPGGSNLHWPQRLASFGDDWLLTYLGSDANDGGGGRVWLAALDADFKLIEAVQATEDDVGNHRPWFARKGATLAMSYDREVQPRARLAALGDDGGDDGILDTADPGGDSDDSGGEGADELQCLCASSTPGAAGAALAVAAAAVASARRRRRR